MRRYQLIALDLDGTTIPDDLQIRPRVREAIAQAMARGVHVTLATGRAFAAITHHVEALGITAPVICYQGGLVKDPVTRETMYQKAMSKDLALEAIEMAERDGLHMMVYIEDEVYITEMRYEPAFYDRWFGLQMHLVPDLRDALAGDRDPIKFLIIADEESCDQLHPLWKAHFEGRLQIVRSHRLFVEGNSLGVSKGHALAFVAKHLGVPQDATIAVGDNDNDRSMLEWAGLGVAVGNASPSLRAIADYVAPPVTEDGVAEVIERFILTLPEAS